MKKSSLFSNTKVVAVFSTVIRLGIGLVWIIAGYTKAIDPNGTKKSIQGYRIISGDLVDFISLILPMVEIILGVFLILGIFVKTAALASILVFSFFTIIIFSAWFRRLEINCGCFGNSVYVNSAKDYWIDMLRDIFFVACSAWLLVFPKTYFPLDNRLKMKL